jgi:hypothetical protein
MRLHSLRGPAVIAARTQGDRLRAAAEQADYELDCLLLERDTRRRARAGRRLTVVPEKATQAASTDPAPSTHRQVDEEPKQ